MTTRGLAIAFAVLALLTAPAAAQITVLDQAQDQAQDQAEGQAQGVAPPAPPPPCGTQPLTIARMAWPSAELLAEIHARILTQEFGCDVRIAPGDLAATASSMGSTGQPAVAPELWVNRISDVWNAAMDAQMVRSAAPTYAEGTFEGWFMPSYMAASFPEGAMAAGLATVLPELQSGLRIRFISCPIDWGCSVINRNLLAAHGLAGLVDLVEPANRFEMDKLIAEAVNLREPFLFYYWQPNAVLAQLDFVPVDMGAFDEAATQCLARRACSTPTPSAFAPDLVVVALAERVFTSMPAIAAYFQRTTLPLAEMDALLAQLSATESSAEAVAERFVAERRDIWGSWVGSGTP